MNFKIKFSLQNLNLIRMSYMCEHQRMFFTEQSAYLCHDVHHILYVIPKVIVVFFLKASELIIFSSEKFILTEA